MPKINILFRYIVLLLVCWGAHAWFTWEWESNVTYKYIIYAVFSVIGFAYVRSNKLNLSIERSIPSLILLFIAIVPLSHVSGLGAYLHFLFYGVMIVIIKADESNAKELAHFVAKSLSYIILPGILLHLLFIAIGPLPSLIINGSGLDFFNYGVLIRPINQFYTYSRFHSIFLEPGYLGTLISFLLYATHFEYKERYTKILILALILTFSIAGYIISFLGFVLYLHSIGAKAQRYILFLLLILPFYLFGTLYNSGDNVINHAVIERLQLDEEKGLSGNDRFSVYTDNYYEEAVKSGELIFGVGRISNAGGVSDETQITGAGYKVFFISNGIVCALFFLLFYLSIGRFSSYYFKYTVGFIILITLTFLQAAYPTSWSWIVPYILGVNAYKKG